MRSVGTAFPEDDRPRSADLPANTRIRSWSRHASAPVPAPPPAAPTEKKPRKKRQVKRRILVDLAQPYNLAIYAAYTVVEVATYMGLGRDWVDLRFKENRQGEVWPLPPSSISRGRLRKNKKYLIPYDTLISFLKRRPGPGGKGQK